MLTPGGRTLRNMVVGITEGLWEYLEVWRTKDALKIAWRNWRLMCSADNAHSQLSIGWLIP